MASFTCGDNTAMGRSVMGCHNESADLMGWGIPKWIKKTGSFFVEAGEQTLDVLDIKKSGETKRAEFKADIDGATKNMNSWMATINSGTSEYKLVAKPLAELIKLWYNVSTNVYGQVSQYFPPDIWAPRISKAAVEASIVYYRNTKLIMSYYRQGLNADTADIASAAANDLLNEYTALKTLAIPSTKKSRPYEASQRLVDKLVSDLRNVSNKLRTAGRATAPQAELTTAQKFTEIGERQKALSENGLPIIPIAIAGAAAIGAILIFKG